MKSRAKIYHFIIYGILLVGMIVSTSLISSFMLEKNKKRYI